MVITLNQVIAGMLLLLEGYADEFDIKFAIEKMKKVGFSVDNEHRLAASYSVRELDNKNSPGYQSKKRELEDIATNEVIEFLKGLDINELILRKFSSGSSSIYQNVTPGILEAYQAGYLNFDFGNYTYLISEKGRDYLAVIDDNLEPDKSLEDCLLEIKPSSEGISLERKHRANSQEIG